MTHRTNPSVLASSAMTAPHISDHSTYYHEDELASVPTSGPGHAETTGPPSPTNLPPRRLTTSEIGQWKTFATGPFAGRTVRAEIVEVQKADLGRKFADPPTSVSSAAERSGSGSHGGEDGEGMGVGSREREGEQHDRDLGGEKEKEKDNEGRAVRKARQPLGPPPVVSLQLFESVHHGTPHQHERVIPAEDVEIDGLFCQVDLYRAPIDPVALPPPSESDKLTGVLFGEAYVHACSILDLSGRLALYFVFADLPVKLEGQFRPCYRFFDLFSWTAGSADVPVLAQCFGGAFAV